MRNRFRVSMFFDGTQNNRNNVRDRQMAEAQLAEYQSRLNQVEQNLSREDLTRDEKNMLEQERRWLRRCIRQAERAANADGSFASAETNVSKLQTYMLDNAPGFDEHIVAYIEGIGTRDGQSDNLVGMATGRGGTGIIAKVARGISRVISAIRGADCPDREIELIQLDAVGFSRGAAAARNFVHAALNTGSDSVQEQLRAAGYTVDQVEVRFVGLFDTVAAFGVSRHHLDTGILSLDAISAAQKVVQLAAADEYRNNFPLTNIASAGGTEIVLPGVHTDVGGGYRDAIHEEDLLVFKLSFYQQRERHRRRVEEEKRWLINEGWATASQIDDSGWRNRISVTRRRLRNTYDRIPLKIMAHWFQQEQVNFSADLDLRNEISAGSHPELAQLEHVLGPDGQGNWRLDPDLMRRIRNRYFHISANYDSFVNVPRWSTGDPLTGVRERLILRG